MKQWPSESAGFFFFFIQGRLTYERPCHVADVRCVCVTLAGKSFENRCAVLKSQICIYRVRLCINVRLNTVKGPRPCRRPIVINVDTSRMVGIIISQSILYYVALSKMFNRKKMRVYQYLLLLLYVFYFDTEKNPYIRKIDQIDPVYVYAVTRFGMIFSKLYYAK